MMFVHQNLLCIQYVNEQMPKVGMYRKVIRKKKMKKKISGLIFLKSPLDLTVNDDDYFFFWYYTETLCTVLVKVLENLYKRVKLQK